MSQKSAIILLSGGLDSTVCLWWAQNQQYKQVDCITFEYGSKEETVLVQTTKKLGSLAKVNNHEFIRLEFLADFSRRIGSSLAQGSKKELPKLSSDELDDLPAGLESARAVWIPGRNLLFLSIASAYSEIIGNEVDIITGFNLEEGSTFPDNTQEFIDDFTRAASRGILNAKVSVISPLVGMKKNEIVELGSQLSVPFEFSNSCYNPKGFDKKERPIHCGACESCMRRKRGFIESTVKDPTIYEK
ncbi:MAG: 7-cyano-7-deazaguanine synthase QueC [Asgard group archaeon]|nr:7-cyano-7-deazaguanine synthase QueC [Asgard group archaeon]